MLATQITPSYSESPPQWVRESALMKAGGCAILDHFVNAVTCARFLEESKQCLHSAVASQVTMSDDEEIRGGNPARSFVSAAGGTVQTEFYHSPQTAQFLAEICNTPVKPTGRIGTYSYYRPGDHLALHRDIHSCDVSVITCLLDRHRNTSNGGITRFYPNRQHEPLSRIRATPSHGAIRVRLPVGSTMIFFGGLIPHLIEPLGASELRIVSILCFR